MWYRKYIGVGAIGLMLVMLVLVGSIRPIAAQQCLLRLTPPDYEALRELIDEEDYDDVIARLKQMAQSHYPLETCTKEAFENALKEHLNSSQLKRYKKDILKLAKEIDSNYELFDKLSEDDKIKIISELKLGSPQNLFAGIEFQGQLITRPVELLGTPETNCVKFKEVFDKESWSFGVSSHHFQMGW